MSLNKRQTREVREIVSRLVKGPASFSGPPVFQDDYTREGLIQAYKIWVRTWVLPELNDLLPDDQKVMENGARV